MRIVIIGPKGSGKSTLGQSLAQQMNLGFMDTSTILIDALRDICVDSGLGIHPDKSESFSDFAYCDHIGTICDNKEQLRPSLIALGNMLCDANPAYLWLQCLDRGASIIAGVRRHVEANAICSRSNGGFCPDCKLPSIGYRVVSGIGGLLCSRCGQKLIELFWIKIQGKSEGNDNYELSDWAPEDPSRMLTIGRYPNAKDVIEWLDQMRHATND